MSPACVRALDHVERRDPIERMNRLVLKIILRLGRYAVLPVVELACAILAFWIE